MSVDDGLRPLFRKHLPPPHHLQSIETGGTGRGVPDTNFCIGGVDGWIEFKATSGFTIDLRPEQIGWLVTRERHGGRTFVAVRRRTAAGPRREVADELYLFRGYAARELKVLGLRPLQPPYRGPSLPPGCLLGQWAGGPTRWSWDAVRAVLVSV